MKPWTWTRCWPTSVSGQGHKFPQHSQTSVHRHVTFSNKLRHPNTFGYRNESIQMDFCKQAHPVYNNTGHTVTPWAADTHSVYQLIYIGSETSWGFILSDFTPALMHSSFCCNRRRAWGCAANANVAYYHKIPEETRERSDVTTQASGEALKKVTGPVEMRIGTSMQLPWSF